MGHYEQVPTTQASSAFTELPYGDRTPAVQQFFSGLRRLPLDAWARGSRSVRIDPQGRAEEPMELKAARAKLRLALDRMPRALGRAKGRVKDIIEVASDFTDTKVTCAAMQRVAITAVLALIARPYLAEDEFAMLYGPFAELIPIEEAGIRSAEVLPAWGKRAD